jgi:ABC-type hemin transport system substrate-binding protein
MKTWFALLSALPLVAFAAAQEKIVTLGGDVTEIVYALGADSSLVARQYQPVAAGSERAPRCGLFAPA